MASRRELVRMFVLDSMCDDYEHLDISISPHIGRLGSECGMTIVRPEIVRALSDLIELGWAKAYRLDGSVGSDGFPVEIEGMPSVAEMEDVHGAWFYITDAGRKVLHAWEGWPFDEDNNLRKDWTPPEN